MIFKLVKELPWMFIIALLIWLIVLVFFLYKVYRRDDLIVMAKVLVTLLFILLPLLGILIYAIANLRRNKILLISIILASVLTLVDIWWFIEYIPTHQSRDISNEKAIPFTAAALVNEFLSHETKADSLYTNKVVEITGEIVKIETDSASTTIVLKSDIPNSVVTCRLKRKQSTQVGNTALIKGIITGYILGQVQINEAVLIRQSPSLQTKQPIVSYKDTAMVVKPVKDSVITSTVLLKKPVGGLYTTNKAQVKFLSTTSEEDIEAVNSQGISQINSSTGQVTFAVLIKGFHFENELMQNHFNDKDYMNSALYPKSEFKGTIKNINTVDFSKDGTHPVTASGNLTIHGFTHKITASGTLSIVQGVVKLKSVFKIKRVDYGITTNEVAEVLEITVTSKYDYTH